MKMDREAALALSLNLCEIRRALEALERVYKQAVANAIHDGEVFMYVSGPEQVTVITREEMYGRTKA